MKKFDFSICKGCIKDDGEFYAYLNRCFDEIGIAYGMRIMHGGLTCQFVTDIKASELLPSEIAWFNGKVISDHDEHDRRKADCEECRKRLYEVMEALSSHIDTDSFIERHENKECPYMTEIMLNHWRKGDE